MEILGESSSKSKTAGSICIRWKIRKKLGEFRASQRDGLKFRNWKLETLRRRPMACICRSLKGTAFHSSLPIVLPPDTITAALKFTRKNPSHRLLSPIQLSESGLKSWDSFPSLARIHRILFHRKQR